MRKFKLSIAVLFIIFLAIPEGHTQNAQNRANGRLAVFLDCPWWCDENFIMEEIPVVSYVRDKELADVHVMMTRHGGGMAGTSYVISFYGYGEFEGQEYELSYWAPRTNTADQNRRGYTNKLKMGLVYFIAQTPVAGQVQISFDYDPERPVLPEEEIEDPWNRWVFEIYGGGNYRKEEKSSSMSFRYGLFADKITHDWKIRLRPYFNYSERTFVTEEEDIRSISHRNGFNGQVVKSINQHWSVGVFNTMLSSTFHNMAFNVELTPAVEYSLFPYREATRRSISFAYRMGYGYHNYREETIFEKEVEFLFGHSLEAAARFQQPWGSIRAGISGSHYFHDFSANRAEFFANVNLRLFQGFALSLSGNLDLINDLRSIPLGDLSVEEILLEQSQQSTSYQINASIGLTYTFGSDFTGVFNPRL